MIYNRTSQRSDLNSHRSRLEALCIGNRPLLTTPADLSEKAP